MNRLIKITCACLATTAFALTAPAAWAGCGMPFDSAATAGTATDALTPPPARTPHARPAATSGLFQTAGYTFAGDDDMRRPAAYQGSIVGLWNVTFTSGGQQVDTAYVQWHADGTEFMQSAGRSPASGNVCVGVYRQTGFGSYRLSHYALAYDPASGKLTNRIVFRMDVSLDGTGNTYSGPFTQTIYDAASGAQVVQFTGTVTGQRITAG